VRSALAESTTLADEAILCRASRKLALNALEAIVEHIALDNLQAARDLASHVFKHVDQLRGI
jgi:hypothetical protein